MYIIGFNVKYWLFLSDFNETLIFSTDFRKNLNIKYNQNPSSESQVVTWGQTDIERERWTGGRTERQTDLTEPTVVFAILRRRLRSRKLK